MPDIVKALDIISPTQFQVDAKTSGECHMVYL